MSCNRTFNVLEMPQKIWLGRKGEMNFRPVSFAWDVWHKEHPGATLSVIYTSPNKDIAPLVVATGTSTPVIWQPTTDVSTVSGYGSVECHLIDGDEIIGISAAAITIIDDSASGTSATAPSWVDQVVREVAEAAGHYPKIENGYWLVWDAENEEWSNTDVRAYGIDGRDGSNGADGHSPYIGTNGHWFVYDDVHETWSDTGVSASVDETVIANAVAAYLEEHPITETDPTVPNWAKQPTKPTYTASEVGALPADTPIPAAVTEQTVSGWGFTKNTGTYSKPSGGIPKTDLAQAVQTSLGKADTALQTAPVTSVNSKTGAVVLKTSDLTNDSGFQTEPFEIPITRSGSTYTTTATAAEILAHADNCVAVVGGVARLTPDYVGVSGTTALLVFGYIYVQSPTAPDEVFAVVVQSNSVTVSHASRDVKDLPTVTASDNGKFLRVVSGAWAAASVPTAESNSFGGGS